MAAGASIAKGQGIDLKITGLENVLRRVDDFDSIVYKELQGEVRTILDRTVSVASRRYPGGSWAVSFGKQFDAPVGMVATTGGSSKGYASFAAAPGGVRASVFDTAGRKGEGKTPQAKAMIASLTKRYGAPQRFLWPAWMENRSTSLSGIQVAVNKAERKMQSIIDSGGA